MYNRKIDFSLVRDESCFFWCARQTGKSTLLRERFNPQFHYDLLLSDQYARLLTSPFLLREEIVASGLNGDNQKDPVIIDEIQKVPELLDEVHWLIENRGLRFILCGSSARKLKRGHANLLGGRAVRYELFPLVYHEIPNFDLSNALNRGLIPRMYDSSHSRRFLQSYASDYLKEEIAAEALTRNVPAFSRFLDNAALSNGEILNYQNIASECGISAPTVKEYFQILEDTLIGSFLPAFRKRVKRRVIGSPKFYFFDVGLAGYLSKRSTVHIGSAEFGKAFEHFIHMELRAHSSYSELNYPLSYWRTSSGYEVDFVLNEGETAIEVKSSDQVNYRHLKGLRAFREEHSPRRAIVVSRDPAPRKTDDGIEILPWRVFLDELWTGL
jgi:predicted AAA+ superfamily ATPase